MFFLLYMSTFNKLFSPEIVKHMNIISDLENSICVLESVLKRAKIQYAIARDKQRVFELKNSVGERGEGERLCVSA